MEEGWAGALAHRASSDRQLSSTRRSAAQRDALLHVHAEQQQHEERLEQPLERDALVVPVERTTASAARREDSAVQTTTTVTTRCTERDVLLVPGCGG